ncbi:MAG TPA: GerMN domain-containing protein [Leptolyngbyaceae cyanobacterium M65_K2018_010]|nr:GerMN domain-containing protein [Leptolyngbyaceae cyanobacterium M65_K2018_010]
MDLKDKIRRIPLGILVGLVTLTVASGGSVAWFTWRALNPKPPVAEFPTLEAKPETAVTAPAETAPAQPDTPTAPAKEPPTPAPAAQITGQIYWLRDEGNGFKLVPEEIAVSAGTKPNDQVKAAFAALLSQPGDPDQNAFTTIPEQTKLLDATVAADGVHVNLSADFQTGGGSASMMGRLGQVIYTATAFNPEAPVWISVEGKPLTLLGGEGLEVAQPMTRADFDQGFQL